MTFKSLDFFALGGGNVGSIYLFFTFIIMYIKPFNVYYYGRYV